MDTNTKKQPPLWKQLMGALAGMFIALGLYQAWGSVQPTVQGYLLSSPLFSDGARAGEMRFSDKDAVFSEYRKAATVARDVSRILTGSDQQVEVTVLDAASSSSRKPFAAMMPLASSQASSAPSVASAATEASVPAFEFTTMQMEDGSSSAIAAEASSSSAPRLSIAAINRANRLAAAATTAQTSTDAGKGDDGKGNGKGKGPGLPSSGPAGWALGIVALGGAVAGVPSWRRRLLALSLGK